MIRNNKNKLLAEKFVGENEIYTNDRERERERERETCG